MSLKIKQRAFLLFILIPFIMYVLKKISCVPSRQWLHLTPAPFAALLFGACSVSVSSVSHRLHLFRLPFQEQTVLEFCLSEAYMPLVRNTQSNNHYSLSLLRLHPLLFIFVQSIHPFNSLSLKECLLPYYTALNEDSTKVFFPFFLNVILDETN